MLKKILSALLLLSTLSAVQWWAPGSENAGRCGPDAPLLNNDVAICDPNSPNSYCCSQYGYCGSSDAHCNCESCVNFKANPNHKYKFTPPPQVAAGTVNSQPAKCNKKVIGYYPSWGSSVLSNYQASLMTHILFAFLPMAPDGTVSVNETPGDNSVENRVIELFKVTKQFPHLRIMFSVGGWGRSDNFPAVTADANKRRNFVQSTLKMIKTYGFHGVDIDWEYPTSAADMKNFVLFAKDIREGFDAYEKANNLNEKLLITIAGPAYYAKIDSGFELGELVKYLDMINAMTYDYFGAWEKYTASHAPLYNSAPSIIDQNLYIDRTMESYVCGTLAPHKVILGIPFYGRYWRNVGEPIEPGNGMWRISEPLNGDAIIYKDIASKYNDNPEYVKYFDNVAKASYIYNAKERFFVGYDSPEVIKEKIKYVDDMNLGGLMVWSIDQDTSDNALLKLLGEASICSNMNPNDLKYACGNAAPPTNPIVTPKTTLMVNGPVQTTSSLPSSQPASASPSQSSTNAVTSSTAPTAVSSTASTSVSTSSTTTVTSNSGSNSGKRWWTYEDGWDKNGRCGPTAPKINGQNPICNPTSAGPCCSKWGFCGSSDSHCKCSECVDYRNH